MTATRKTSSTIILTLFLGTIAAVWLFFAPPQLLGSTTYTATDGNSMEPMFHKGDLALTRPASSYHVGDVVLYMSPTLHRPVLHRIIAIQHGHYFFKGDHNTFVDPGYATRSELIGHLWFHVNGGGKVLSWMGKPSHASVIAALATILLVLSGAGTVRRRRRRGRRGDSTFTPPAAQSANGLPVWLHKPRKTTDNFIAGGALALGLLLIAIGFMTPLRKSTPVNAYTQLGNFNYTAQVIHADPAYPTGALQTGQPLFFNDFKTATLSFSYQFKSQLKHQVHGTIAFSAQLSSDTTWHRNVAIMSRHTFNGDLAVASGNVDLAGLRALLTKLGQDTGDAGAAYTVTLQPIVTVKGVVGGKPISDTFTPTLPFSITDAVAKLNVAGPATLPGASYQTASPADAQASALEPTKAGTIPGSTARFFTFARYSLPISELRGIGIGLLALVGLVLLLKPLKPKREIWSAERRVAFRYGSVVVDVEQLAATGDVTVVRDFENLALMARYLERPIYKAVANGIETYAVEDGGRMHIFRRPEAKQPELVVPMQTLPPEPSEPRRRRVHLRIAAAVLMLVGLIAVGTAFTAATVVPQSNVGVSTESSSAAQLAPAACTGTITNVYYVPTGNKNQTVNTSNTLIVGSSGNDTVTAGASSGYQCFIGGGPTSPNNDKYTGRAGQGSQCIVATADATGNTKNCTVVSRTP